MKTELSWREATAADVALLAQWNRQLICDEGHRNPMSEAELALRMQGWRQSGDYRAIVFSTDEPVGYALFRREGDSIYLRQFFVRRERRRLGLGRAAMGCLRREIWSPDVRLTVDVLVGNEAAVAFWRSVGYRDYALTLEIVPPHLTLTAVAAEDFAELAEIRIAAMRASLERVGRFDPARARERLRSTFVPERTWFIVQDGVRIGFYATRDSPEGLWLDHLYLQPEAQGRGVGSRVLRRMLAAADERQIPVRVGALKQSDANRFYRRHGFVFVDAGEWDNYYVRPVRQAEARSG